MLWIAAVALESQDRWDRQTLAQLRALSESPETLQAHADAMQARFPEGRLFTVALTGLAWRALAERHAVPLRDAERQVWAAVSLAEHDATRRTFGPAGGLPHGLFYDAWTTHLLLALSRPSPVWRDSLARRCQRLHRVLDGDALWVDSYPGQAWPADAVVGAAALAGCGRLDPGHAETARQWLGRVRQHLDPQTGLIPHAAGQPQVRGSSTALMSPFLAQIDRRFARDQHLRFRRQFGARLGGILPVRREFMRGESQGGDIDSGPVVFGVSAPASVVGIAAARTGGDEAGAQALRATVELLGVPVGTTRRHYAFGLLPVGDAFLAWASAVPMAPAQATASSDWRGRWVGAALAGLVLGGWGVCYGSGGSSRARASTSGHRSR